MCIYVRMYGDLYECVRLSQIKTEKDKKSLVSLLLQVLKWNLNQSIPNCY